MGDPADMLMGTRKMMPAFEGPTHRTVVYHPWPGREETVHNPLHFALEKPWEERLAEQRAQDELERQMAEKAQLLSNKRAPHLTNLNEDVQLTGKVYYGLAGLAQQPVRIGRHGADPTPQIALRGAGVQA